MKRLMTAALLMLSLGVVPPLVGTADADRGPAFCRDGRGHPVFGRDWCIERGYWHRPRDWYPGHRGRGVSSWDIVRRDPCLSREYREYASDHKNPNKRARFVDRLARE